MLSRRSFALGLASLGAASFLRGAERGEAEVSVDVAKTHVDFHIGKALAFRYVTDPKAAKPYLWPLDVAGLAVTRSWPMDAGKGEAKDHIHHRSAWFCHGDVVPLDVKFVKHFRDVKGVDFWSERRGHGRIVCTSVKKLGNGIETTNDCAHLGGRDDPQ